MNVILKLLCEREVRATFFVLGEVADRHPEIVAKIAEAGHEIGVHGWSHRPIYAQSPARFREELARASELLRRLTGQTIRAHRAAFFSIRADSRWALDDLAAAGITIDSSVFPIHNHRYGMPAAPRWPHWVAADRLIEFPISTVRFGPLNLPFSGGFYARALPYPLIRGGIDWLNANGQPANAYFHPWEFDPNQPRWPRLGGRLARWTHYHQLASTTDKLRRLLDDFDWAPISEALAAHGLPAGPSLVAPAPALARCQPLGA